MYGNWRYNLVMGLTGFILVFFIALSSNPVLTALLRGVYSFIAFFIIAYVIRFIWGTFIFPPARLEGEEQQDTDQISGQTIDFVAGQESENLNDLIKQQLTANSGQSDADSNAEQKLDGKQEEANFKPLKPTQLFSNKSVQPEEISKAIRHLTGE